MKHRHRGELGHDWLKEFVAKYLIAWCASEKTCTQKSEIRRFSVIAIIIIHVSPCIGVSWLIMITGTEFFLWDFMILLQWTYEDHCPLECNAMLSGREVPSISGEQEIVKQWHRFSRRNKSCKQCWDCTSQRRVGVSLTHRVGRW
jgi:hypothetical protein